ncbi:hypothetical protein [Hyalangium sp.]|nr:hypothetical protein [Hyalangium sp.]HYI01721.1 hypothetical protein [Hyalangium sp.]
MPGEVFVEALAEVLGAVLGAAGASTGFFAFADEGFAEEASKLLTSSFR